ncbi:GTPase npa3 [Ceratocystis lukuohia]|uniref:GPN-loop GTPase n=2 Tax=Ceratocystis TaxID=5157 RepID=A0A0F8AWN5_CERFI|nr:GTPase npa3 [Ceratocystis platani]
MSSSTTPKPKRPVAVVCVGMAGSGKTTFMRRINSYLHGKEEPPYVINLDPAVLNVPFESNIDIRDSVNYEEVMKQYNLGPNGGIITSLNLFATKIDQVMHLLEKRAAPTEQSEAEAEKETQAKPEAIEGTDQDQPNKTSDPQGEDKPVAAQKQPKSMNHILIDTPGQIEVFVWSASGSIILESLASSFPTVIAYVIDTPRTASTSTFMSNMLYACSILYKTKLPMILVFNKTDVKDASFATKWMTDYEAFQAALREDEERDVLAGEAYGGGGSGYMGSLLNSMSLVLEEFYSHLNVVGVSSRVGTGMEEFFAAVQQKADEFERDYQPELERKRAARDSEKEKARQKELEKMMKGMHMDTKGPKAEAQSSKDISERTKDEIEDNDIDSDEYADDDEEDREGLQARYEAAREAEQDSIMADGSFAKYLYTKH